MSRTLIALAALLLSLPALADDARARMGGGCQPEDGTFVVPLGKTAYNFRVSALSRGTPCGMTTNDYRGFGVQLDGGEVYRFFEKETRATIDTPPLSSLSLGAGTYSLYVDGGVGAQVVIQYDVR